VTATTGTVTGSGTEAAAVTGTQAVSQALPVAPAFVVALAL
jgi:hypothetical protein